MSPSATDYLGVAHDRATWHHRAWRGMDLDPTDALVQQSSQASPAWAGPSEQSQSCTPALGTVSGPPRSNAVGATEHPQASCG